MKGKLKLNSKIKKSNKTLNKIRSRQEEYAEDEETEEYEKLVRNKKTSRIPSIPCIYKKQNSSEKLIKRQIDEDERPIKPTKNYSKQQQQENESENEKYNLTSRSYTVQEKFPSQINNKKPITRPSCLLNSTDDLLVVTPYLKNPDGKRNNFTEYVFPLFSFRVIFFL